MLRANFVVKNVLYPFSHSIAPCDTVLSAEPDFSFGVDLQ